MSPDFRSDTLAQRVAEAAAAWLRDPGDATAYLRLVDATVTWEAHARPPLEGLERAGGVPDVETIRATVLAVMEQLRQRRQADEASAGLAALADAHRDGPPPEYPSDWPWEPQPPQEPREDDDGVAATPDDALSDLVIMEDDGTSPRP
ncbi:hypothetical protein [Cellulomonas carbonis]|uniref:Uncharacterized protein n=1 Tax=Cellulomonas carbonis T26 TaxID=947969 RepID=A0A0A0BRM3_9CELL|nr:hypothetical protein [Cellulomonas carbonis]KGM09734.1 hypothetical protein N868_09515 [Cellulomonas carbonis T26]GGB99948.1 hypothetical protein GCM10010972_10900 [Cellulomonas carbonis]